MILQMLTPRKHRFAQITLEISRPLVHGTNMTSQMVLLSKGPLTHAAGERTLFFVDCHGVLVQIELAGEGRLAGAAEVGLDVLHADVLLAVGLALEALLAVRAVEREVRVLVAHQGGADADTIMSSQISAPQPGLRGHLPLHQLGPHRVRPRVTLQSRRERRMLDGNARLASNLRTGHGREGFASSPGAGER